MSRTKKGRKGGDNSPKLQGRTKQSERTIAGKKKATGNKTGSRHNESLIHQQASSGEQARKADTRHGSKKPVALNLPSKETKAVAKPKKPKLSDEQMLLKLEEDPRLNKLLDMLEEGRDLNQEDQTWLDSQLNQIERLMKNLGIGEDGAVAEQAPSQKAKSDDDLLAAFESGADLLKDYQDKD